MQIIKYICLFFAITWSMSCSNVKRVVYDKNTRQEVAHDTKKTYSKSVSGKEVALKNAIVSTAKQNLGRKYTYGGISPKQGFDCSGLVYYSAKTHQIELPRSSRSLAEAGPHINWKSAAPGDLIFFGERKKVNHVGIIEKINSRELYVIHSTSSRGVISENVLASTYWNKRILFAIEFSTFIR